MACCEITNHFTSRFKVDIFVKRLSGSRNLYSVQPCYEIVPLNQFSTDDNFCIIRILNVLVAVFPDHSAGSGNHHLLSPGQEHCAAVTCRSVPAREEEVSTREAPNVTGT